MLSNKGTVSFVLYGTFISITIIAMSLAFYYIEKGTMDTDKMTDLFKYSIVPSAIATTHIITDLFKEHDHDEFEKQKILSSLNAVKTNSYLVILGVDISNGEIKPELKWTLDNTGPNTVIYKKGKWYRTVIPVITSFQDVQKIVHKIKNSSTLSHKVCKLKNIRV